MPRQPEGKLVKAAKRLIESRGGRCFNIHGGDNPFQEVGIPDLLCCYRGRFIGPEGKQEGESPSPKQLEIIGQIHGAGGIAFAFHSLDQVRAVLDNIDKEVDD